MTTMQQINQEALIRHLCVVKEYWGQFGGLHDTEANYSSSIDVAIETDLREQLWQINPSFGFVGEELENKPGSPFWLVDPRDGTAVAELGGRYWSSVVALVHSEDSSVPFVSVYQPGTLDHFIHEFDRAPFVERTVLVPSPTSAGSPPSMQRVRFALSPSITSFLGDMHGCAYMPSSDRERMPEVNNRLKGLFREVTFPVGSKSRPYGACDVKPGSGSASLMACKVADGTHDFHILFGQGAYDSPGFVIAQHAGCVVRCGQGDQWDESSDIETLIASSEKTDKINVAVFANQQQYELIKFLYKNPSVVDAKEIPGAMPA
ncbi:MAG: hypothetical protein QF486_02000 [Candidatus Woesearchaeota archaeon]|jgi:fructose-1,6-bisphosphatase/inositol monophosphatase family enzyme|nr:hypothetical protein [Candidatus Woesearchaeota archaeon]MDP7181013.1 hypothetical protein [Candidatus Woesearchaeota archaeon]MDP7198366.1 hypothetical protein [Candidatus Woesearchaeota archaeon]MDP7467468.1 hypothetical protein [Candidatus Woesearchaeota archaeon]MDP7647695.1 hypothetical protein [Candidatus Woesearchaeota archaeon]